MSQHKRQLLEKIEGGHLHVGVIGMGYVGLPLALTFVERAGFEVTGFDVDQTKVDQTKADQTKADLPKVG